MLDIVNVDGVRVFLVLFKMFMIKILIRMVLVNSLSVLYSYLKKVYKIFMNYSWLIMYVDLK